MMNTPNPAVATSTESFAALFEESLSRKEMRLGEIITKQYLI